MKKIIILISVMIILFVIPNTQATTIYFNDMGRPVYQNNSVQVMEATDWDINTDTVITDGEYNQIRVDYENPLGYTKVEVIGGIVNYYILAYNNCTVKQKGGSVYSIFAYDNSKISISGGYIRNLWAGDNSKVYIYGNFNFMGEITELETKIFGTLQNGDVIPILTISKRDNATITVIPEPNSLLIIATCVIVTLHRRKIVKKRNNISF